MGDAMILGFALLSVSALCFALALRRRRIAKRNAQLAALEPFRDGAHAAERLLRRARGLAVPSRHGVIAPPNAPEQRAVWLRYVLEELSNGWVEVLSECRPHSFKVSIAEGEGVEVHAPEPGLLLLRPSHTEVLTDLFDDELPDEVRACGASFAARVDEVRTQKEALYRVRAEWLLEGEHVTVAGHLHTPPADDPERASKPILRLRKRAKGTLLANVDERELLHRPSALWDGALLLVALSALLAGLYWLRQNGPLF